MKTCRRSQVLLLISLILLLPFQLFASSTNLKVTDFMTEKEFKEAGLKKLSKAELEKLNSWFVKFAVVLLAEETSSGRYKMKVDRVSKEIYVKRIK